MSDKLRDLKGASDFLKMHIPQGESCCEGCGQTARRRYEAVQALADSATADKGTQQPNGDASTSSGDKPEGYPPPVSDALPTADTSKAGMGVAEIVDAQNQLSADAPPEPTEEMVKRGVEAFRSVKLKGVWPHDTIRAVGEGKTE